MAEMVTLTINGQEVTAPAGATVLEAAREANIYIPTLCSNEELTPYGACRLCVVEISHGKRSRIAASCVYEVAEGLKVETATERVLQVRRLVAELLLVRNPQHPVMKRMAREIGIDTSRFEGEVKGCILCAQCVRTCREVVGVSAIGFKGRGGSRMVATPFDGSPPDCIACGSCSYICPVDVIPMEDKDGIRTIWHTDFPMVRCEKCGKPFMPEKQVEYFSKITEVPKERFKYCFECR